MVSKMTAVMQCIAERIIACLCLTVDVTLNYWLWLVRKFSSSLPSEYPAAPCAGIRRICWSRGFIET